MLHCHLWQLPQYAHFTIQLHLTYSQNPIPGAPFAAMSHATRWRGGLFDWSSHGLEVRTQNGPSLNS
jgi:hypothetical protein